MKELIKEAKFVLVSFLFFKTKGYRKSRTSQLGEVVATGLTWRLGWRNLGSMPRPLAECMRLPVGIPGDPTESQLDSEFSQQDALCLTIEDSWPESWVLEDDSGSYFSMGS